MNKPLTLPGLARAVLQEARANGLTIATAESCTGGMVAAALTDIAGSSDVFDRGFITYSNAAKSAMIGVPPALLAEYGAVSHPVANAMAEGALRVARTGLAVAITGIAGPGGATQGKPVGLVHFAVARADGAVESLERRYGDLGRANIRRAATRDALFLLLSMARSSTPNVA